MTAEVWRDIPGWEGYYQASNQGWVRSVDRIVTFADERASVPIVRTLRGRVIKLTLRADNGRYQVALRRDGVASYRLVHTLVAESFLGPRPDGMEVCHNNSDRLDNTVENLRYDTHQNNCLDTVQAGNHINAQKTQCIHGHEFSPENTYWHKGWRQCVKCSRDRTRLRQSKAKRERPTHEGCSNLREGNASNGNEIATDRQ